MSEDLTPQGAAAVRLAQTVVRLEAERDRARGIAVALEQRLARVLDVHATYFSLDGEPGYDDTTPEPEDVWRYDRDIRDALEADQ